MDNKTLILYIEDNADNLKLVTKVLRVAGYSVIGAENGRDGIKLAGQYHPDLILVDIHLPDLDGFAVTSKIREFEHLARIPILALTANVTQTDRENSLSAGCNGFIEKPIDVDYLPEQIQAFLIPS